MNLDRLIPVVALSAAAALALRNGDWPSVLAFTATLALYAAMRFLERYRASEMSAVREELSELRARVSDLAMRSGGSGFL